MRTFFESKLNKLRDLLKDIHIKYNQLREITKIEVQTAEQIKIRVFEQQL